MILLKFQLPFWEHTSAMRRVICSGIVGSQAAWGPGVAVQGECLSVSLCCVGVRDRVDRVDTFVSQAAGCVGVRT